MSQNLMFTGMTGANRGSTNVKSKIEVVVEQSLELELLRFAGLEG